MEAKEEKDKTFWDRESVNPLYVFVSVLGGLGGAMILGAKWVIKRNKDARK